MKMAKIIRIFVLGILFALWSFQPGVAQIYKWTDDKGTVHFTEDPSTIPKRYLNETEVKGTPEVSSDRKSPSIIRNFQYTYPLQKQQPTDRETTEVSQDCGPGEYETNVFMMRYLGDKSKRSADLVQRCTEILKKCCHYNPAEFAKLVDQCAKDAKWNVIPAKIPGLLSSYCGRGGYETGNTSAIPIEGQKPFIKKKEVTTNPGAIDIRTGEFYPGVPGGIINPRTGEFMPEVGGGYIDPKTGRFIPKH